MLDKNIRLAHRRKYLVTRGFTHKFDDIMNIQILNQFLEHRPLRSISEVAQRNIMPGRKDQCYRP